MPEIGLNGLLLDYPYSGSAVYARNLVPLLPETAPELDFRLYVRQPADKVGNVATQELRTPFARVNRGAGIGARLDKLAWEIGAWPMAARSRGDALLHSLYFSAPLLAPAPVVVTIHDLISLAIPGYYRSHQSALYSRLMAFTAKRAAAIITVSEYSKRDIVRHLGVDENRVTVTHEAVDERYRDAPSKEELERVWDKYGLPKRFVLYMGGAERRKNLETLIRAWAEIAQPMRDGDVSLVLAANFPPPDSLFPDTLGLIQELGLARDIKVLSEVEEADKPPFYRCALLFCFPSRYEGFGFTPLEAMASGLPVIASNVTSIPEVVDEGALLLAPDDISAWAAAILQLVDSEGRRAELAARGTERAQHFSWRRTAEQTVAVYRQILDR